MAAEGWHVPGFLKLFFHENGMHVCVYMCDIVRVSAPEAINN